MFESMNVFLFILSFLFEELYQIKCFLINRGALFKAKVFNTSLKMQGKL